jgi:ubiquinone/menaquinone biosynthesis C-methylase UbiE
MEYIKQIRKFREKEKEPFGSFQIKVMGRWWSEVELKNVFNALALKGREKILDAGCADGRLIEYIQKRFPSCKLCGIDFALNPMRQILKKDLIACLVCGDVVSLPLKDLTFDLVASIEVIFMLPSYEQRIMALKEFHRVLKEKGSVIITVDNYKTWYGEIDGEKEGFFKSAPDLYAYLYEPEELKEDLEKAGFTVVKVVGINNLPRRYLNRLKKLGVFLDLFISNFFKNLSFKRGSYLLAKGIKRG